MPLKAGSSMKVDSSVASRATSANASRGRALARQGAAQQDQRHQPGSDEQRQQQASGGGDRIGAGEGLDERHAGDGQQHEHADPGGADRIAPELIQHGAAFRAGEYGSPR
jgi:hypothetical protein